MKYPGNTHIWVRYFTDPFIVNDTIAEVRRKRAQLNSPEESIVCTGAGDCHYSVELREEDISVVEDEPSENELDAFRGTMPR